MLFEPLPLIFTKHGDCWIGGGIIGATDTFLTSLERSTKIAGVKQDDLDPFALWAIDVGVVDSGPLSWFCAVR